MARLVYAGPFKQIRTGDAGMRFALILVLVLLLGVGAMANGLSVWVADPLVKIMPDAVSPKNTPAAARIDAVRNEYETAQIVVSAGNKKIEKLAVEAEPVIGPDGPKPRVEARFVGYVPVRKSTPQTPPEHLAAQAPADFPDPLLEEKSVSVEIGKNQPIWLTVYVPKETRPGTYSAWIELVADGQKLRVPLNIEVYPLVLPDARKLQITNWLNPERTASAHGLKIWSNGYWKMLEAYAVFLADYRQNVVMTPVLSLIIGHDDGKGNFTFDFTRFDRWVEIFRKAGVIGTIEGSHLGGRSDWNAVDFNANWPLILMPDGSEKKPPAVNVSSSEYNLFLSQFLPALQKHLEEKGLLGSYIQHLADEPISVNAESYKKLSVSVRKYAPKLKIIDACMCSELAGALNIWVPQPPHFEKDIKFFKERQKAGDTVWFYTCLSPKGKYMNRFIDYPLLDVRLLHWVNFKYNLPGYLHWGLNYWSGDPFKDLQPSWGDGEFLPAGDSHIVYPGKRGPLSSIRMEAMRDGIEDYELLKLLEKKNPKLAREICDSIVRSLTNYTLDPAEFRKARARIIEGLEGQL